MAVKMLLLKLVEDEKIRKYLKARINKGGISRVVIERTMKRVTVNIHTSRPGIIIGRGGTEVDRIKEELKKLTGKEVQINIVEIRRPELEAAIVGETVAKQLEARINYRRALKWPLLLLCVWVQKELRFVWWTYWWCRYGKNRRV
jgi:small subunit ribosomal protein S3